MYLQFKIILYPSISPSTTSSATTDVTAPLLRHRRFRQRIRIDGHLNASFPFLFPLIDDDPVLVRRQRFRIGQFHRTDQIFSKQFSRRFGGGTVVDAFQIGRTRLPSATGRRRQGGGFFLFRRRPLQKKTYPLEKKPITKQNFCVYCVININSSESSSQSRLNRRKDHKVDHFQQRRSFQVPNHKIDRS